MEDERERTGPEGSEPPSGDLHTIGQRLRWAIDAQPPELGPLGGQRRGIRLFQSHMEDRAKELEAGGQKLLGVTLNSIQTYIPREDGTPEETKPSVDFLREAARLLHVREAWLISGDGAPTEAEEVVRRDAERRRRTEMESTIIEGFEAGLGQPFEGLSSIAQAALWQLWASLRGSLVEYVTASDPPGTADDQQSVDRELARRIAVAVRAPLAPFRFRTDGQGVTVARWGRYVAAACDALYALLVYPHPADEEPIPLDWRTFIESREEDASG